jgi:hypothetical protein
LIRWTAFILSSSFRNQAFVGESGKKKLPHGEPDGIPEARDAHKNSNAVMNVITPVMIISLKGGEHELDETFDITVPLPWLQSFGMGVQSAKADEAQYNLRCDLYECLPKGTHVASEPVPFIKTV